MQSFSVTGKVAAIALAALLLAGCGGASWARGTAVSGGGTVYGLAKGNTGAQTADDGIRRALLGTADVPLTVAAVRARLLAQGGKLATHIVANRGHENPEAGSFSFFESYDGPAPGGAVAAGELYIGYFSERVGDQLAVQADFSQGLQIEAIAWDKTKRSFNFWELIGDGKSAAWHYRGDSADVLADNAKVNTGSGGQAGARLRCAGCHTLGGPIMKELDAPNNDWWTAEHKLELGTLQLANARGQANAKLAATLFAQAKDAGHLAGLVKQGTDRMLAERGRQGGQGTRAQLRSLFTTMEMNLATDARPYRERLAGGRSVELPVGFFVDPRLSGDTATVAVPAATYKAGLAAVGSVFAADEQNGLAETRHAFVVPVRSHVDQGAIADMVKRGLLDDELVADVLAVDFTAPVYSQARYGLLKYVPEGATTAAALRTGLVKALQAAPAGDKAAAELLANLTDPKRTAAAHRAIAKNYLVAARKQAATPKGIADYLAVAGQRRTEIDASETSQNPRGKITEPGFRVIFPKDQTRPVPGRLHLDPATATLSGR